MCTGGSAARPGTSSSSNKQKTPCLHGRRQGVFFRKRQSAFDRKEPPEGPAGERGRGEHIPEKGHGEVFQHGAHPDGGQLKHRRAAQYPVKQDGGRQTHGGAHHRHGARLPHQLAEGGRVPPGVAPAGPDGNAKPVAPQIGKQDHQKAHVPRFFQSPQKNAVGHIAQASRRELHALPHGHVVDLHPDGHGVGHDDPENRRLKLVFWHYAALLPCAAKNKRRVAFNWIYAVQCHTSRPLF